MTTSRFRIERCAAHGIAVGLCENSLCKGSAAAKSTSRQLIERIEPPRCRRCKQVRGDAVPRGPFHGAKGNHPGYQERFCDGCWEAKEKRDREAAPAGVSYRDRRGDKSRQRGRICE